MIITKEVWLEEDLSDKIPAEAWYKGFRLKYKYPERVPKKGYLVLEDSRKEEVFIWYGPFPSLGEIFERCKEFVKERY